MGRMGSITLHGQFSLSGSRLLPSPGIAAVVCARSSNAVGPTNAGPVKEEVDDDRILDRLEDGREGGLAIVCRFQLAASHLDGGNDNGAKISLPIIRPIHLIPRSLARSLSLPSHQDKASSDTNEGSTPPKSRARLLSDRRRSCPVKVHHDKSCHEELYSTS